jgi:protein-disulfide isomerase
MAKTRTQSTLDVTESDHVRGPARAPATILVYGDYECPYTKALEVALARLRESDGTSFRTVFRNFPLREIHPHAEAAAEAAEAVAALAGEEAYWRMHDGLFAFQANLDTVGLMDRASESGASPTAVRDAVERHEFAGRVERDLKSGQAAGVNVTPTVFINDERYDGLRNVPGLREAIQEVRV